MINNFADYPSCSFGENVNISSNNLVLGEGVTIQDDVTIIADNIIIGSGVVIEKNTIIKSLTGKMSEVYIGDNVLIGFNSRILVPHFSILDYSQLHNNAFCSGYQPLYIGYNCWIGQNVLLNSFDKLTIGNNVRMGGCQIWTHVASGELLEGCIFHNNAPVIIEDNAWLMGFGHLISPGVTIAKNSIVMAGSVVTKSTEPYKTYSGVPARDITSSLNGWKDITVSDKKILIDKFIEEFEAIYPQYIDKVFNCDEQRIVSDNKEHQCESDEKIFFVENITEDLLKKQDGNSYFCLTSKFYTKKRTSIEIAWLKFAVGYRARFIPYVQAL